MASVGTRTLRAEFLTKSHRDTLPNSLAVIEKQIELQKLTVTQVTEREYTKRFAWFFVHTGLFCPEVLLEAFQLQKVEVINGQSLEFDEEVLVARDRLVLAYKPLFEKLRELQSKEIELLSERMLRAFAHAYAVFEDTWLAHKEIHAVEALQPLANAILALEPLLRSREKEQLLPWPHVKHQKVVSLRCLEGYSKTIGDLSAYVLSSLSRDLVHDPRLLLLMEYVVAKAAEPDPKGSGKGQLLSADHKGAKTFLKGLNDTPEVPFPEPSAAASGSATAAMGLSALLGLGPGETGGAGRGMTLQAYCFRLLGPIGQHANAVPQQRAVGVATVVLSSFDALKEYLLSLKSKLEHIDASLDQNQQLCELLQRYEQSYKKAKKLFMEPGNLV